MQTTPKRTDTQTLTTARAVLEEHSPLEAPGYRCKSHHLYDALPTLERHLNEALTAQLPRRLRRKPQQVALDSHDRPYYSKAERDQAKCVRARAEDGTTRFFRIATAYVIRRGMRLALALHFVMPEHATAHVVERLLDRLAHVGIGVGCLLLDHAGFAAALRARAGDRRASGTGTMKSGSTASHVGVGGT